MILSITVLFIISFTLGTLVLSLYEKKGSEAWLMSLIIGICVFPIIGIILSTFNLLSLDFLIVYLLLLFFIQFNRNYYNIKFGVDYRVGAVLFFSAVMFGIFMYGGLNQGWLEDGDPNGHAVAASYIAHYKTFLKPSDLFIARYMEPYPVGFQIWTGLLSQDGFDVSFTLMWFNYFVISLGYIAIYYLTLTVFKCKDRALAASLVLMALPTFSTRFIFSQSFALTQIIVVLYLIAKTIENKKFVVPAGIVIGSLLLTHPTSAVVLAAFMCIWVVGEFIYERKIRFSIIYSGILGIAIAIPWWLFEFLKYGWDKIAIQLNLIRLGEGVFGFTDPTLRFYTIVDFINVPLNNTIDNMTGIGVGMFVLLVFAFYGVIMGRDKNRVIFTLMTIFGIVAIFSNWLPISFIPTRMWVYMSIPLAIILAQPLVSSIKSNDIGKAFAFMVIATIIFTSVYPKVFIMVQPWGNSRFNSNEEYTMLMYLKTLPVQTKVMDACMYERVWGLNLWDDPLDRESIIYRNRETDTSIYGWDSEGWIGVNYTENATIFNDDAVKMNKFLNSKNYSYIIVGSKCIKYQMLFYNEFIMKIQEMIGSGLFDVAFNVNGEYVFKVK